MNAKNSSKKGSSVELVSKEDLKDSAQQTNGRIDSLDRHMVSLVDKMGNLIEVQIRSEERETRNSETLTRLEKNLAIQDKTQKDYMRDNDSKVIGIEKQLMLLEADDKAEKVAKEKKEANLNKRKNGYIISLAVLFTIALLKILVPELGK